MATATKTRSKSTTAQNTTTTKVSIKNTKENPFYGKRALLDMMQQVSKMTDNPDKKILFRYLDAAWTESNKDKVMKEMFFTLVFSFGDVANREHNLFIEKYGRGKIDKGGNSLRKVFIYAMEWLISKDPKQFYAFLPIIGEYTNLENPFFYQVRSNRKTGKITEVISVVPKDEKKMKEFINKVTDHFASIIRDVRTPETQHALLAKFLPKPKFSQRKRLVTKKSGETLIKKYRMQKDTFEKENFEKEFMTKLSEKLGWEVINYPKNTRFVGLENYKAKYNRMTEAYLFSSKEILKMDKAQFNKWLDTLPAGARFRVQRRLFKKDGEKLITTGKWVGKYGDLATFYEAWMNQKSAAAAVTRELEVKAKTTGLTSTEKEVLKQAKKDSKVNTGADSILDAMAELWKKASSEKEFDVKVENMMRKINIKVPVLVIADVSVSMVDSGRTLVHKDVRFLPNDMARMASTVFLLKNPDSELQQILVTFSDNATVISKKSKVEAPGKNRFMAGHMIEVDNIVDSEDPFSKNYGNVSKLVKCTGGTNLSSVPTVMKQWVDAVPAEADARKEMINNYPVWLVISDGDINNNYNATASVQDFMHKMKQWFGWNGVLVIWDVKNPYVGDEKNKFDNIENVVYYGSCNPQAVHQIFANIDDLDVIDTFQPLLSMHRSNRYQAVRELVK